MAVCGSHFSHITNINPFATLSIIKCERYIFLKKCVRSLLLLIMFPSIVLYVCGYTIYIHIYIYIYIYTPHSGY